MDRLEMSDYYSLSIGEREYIDDLINGLNVIIDTIYEGLTKELIIEVLNIDIEDIPDVLKKITELRVYNGYNPYEIRFVEEGLLIREKTIKNEDDFIDVLSKIPTTQEKVLNIGEISLESIEKINNIVKEKRISYYKDITPKSIDRIIEENEGSLEDIFKIFKRISIIKGYKVTEILLGENGLKIEQEAIKNEDEYLKLLLKNDISIK